MNALFKNILGNDDGCQLNLPARTFAVAIPVSLMLVFNIGALIQTVVAMRKSAQVIVTKVYSNVILKEHSFPQIRK